MAEEVYRVDEDLLDKLNIEGPLDDTKWDFTLVVYRGFTVCAYPFTLNGPMYALGPGRTCFKLGYPSIHFEFRSLLVDAPESMSIEADRVWSCLLHTSDAADDLTRVALLAPCSIH